MVIAPTGTRATVGGYIALLMLDMLMFDADMVRVLMFDADMVRVLMFDAVIVDAPIFMALVLTLEIDAALSRVVKPVLNCAVVVETLDVKTCPHG